MSRVISSFRTSLAVFLLLNAHQAWCGVATDGTMGGATVLGGPNYAITSDLGRQVGGNLFHSFSKFSLTSGEKAIFSGPASVSTLISRVTGGASSINGTISSTIPGANIFLINPSGIAFGPKASLDVTGSFHASTADYVALGASGRFPADSAAAANLTVDPPSAFGFLKPPNPITADGSFLRVPQGKTISVTAGDITLTEANLWSYGGTVALVALASAGEVNSATFTGTASSMGNINISDKRGVFEGPVYTTTGMKGLKVANVDSSGAGGGKIFIRSGAFYMDHSFIFNDTYGNTSGATIDINVTGKTEIISSSITGTGMSGSASGGSMALTAGEVVIRGDLDRSSYINSDSWNKAIGSDLTIKSAGNFSVEGKSWVSADANGGSKAGNVAIDAGNVSIGEGARVSSSAPVLGAGATSGAGSLNIHATGTISVSGDIRSENGDGTSGNISITASELTVSGSGLISSSLLANPSATARRSGNIIIDTNKLSLLDNGRIETRVFYSSNGSSGDVSIKTGILSLTGGGAISSSIDSTLGTGGGITVDASELILIASIPLNQFREKGSIASDSTSGNAGHITLKAPLVSITGGGSVTTIAQGGSGRGGDITVNSSGRILIDGTASDARRSTISTDTLASGNAGNIALSASEVVLSGGAMVNSVAATGSSGSGGGIAIKTTGALTVGGGGASSQVSVETGGSGNAGSIALESSTISLADGGIVSAAALAGSRGNGGLIAVTATDRVTISGATTRAGITGNTASSGDGARIQITTPQLEVKTGGFITAETGAGSSGKGGDVIIATPSVAVSGGRISSATQGSGSAGTIKIDGSELAVSSGGAVSTSADVGSSGSGGSIAIDVRDSFSVVGDFSNVSSDTSGSGAGGQVSVTTAGFKMIDGGSLRTKSSGTGNAGDINVTADTLVIRNGAILDSSSGMLANKVLSKNGDPKSNGSAGNITVNINDDAKISDSMVTTQSATSEGGNIYFTARRGVTIDNGELSASATAGAGNGGNVQLSGDTVILRSGKITAQAEFGDGGNLDIHSNLLVSSSDSVISASSRFGAQGTVLVDAPVVDIGTALASRPGDFINIDAFLPKRCIMPGDGAASTLRLFGGGQPPPQASFIPFFSNL